MGEERERTMNRKLRNLMMLLAMGALLAVLAGCSDDDTNPITGPGMGQGAMLRAVHASPDAPAVDIYVEGVADPVAVALGYTQTTPYLDLAAGTYNIQLRAHGAGAVHVQENPE